MLYHGVLRKMQTEFDRPVQYFLVFESDFIHMNQLLGKRLQITFSGQQCLSCGLDKEIFRQGFCKSCFFDMPFAGDWVMRPELSKAHLGIQDRDLAYEERVQLQPHIVYLANSSNVKVGVTRKSQVPTRWIDQGAHEAIELLEVPNRYLAGIAEVALKEHISDKTNWRKMLKNEIDDANLSEFKDRLKEFIPDETESYFLHQGEELHIEFPVIKYPLKPKSLNIKKEQNFKGILVGIKGQYLIFDDDTVFNVRGNEGNVVNLYID